MQILQGKANFLRRFVPNYATCTQGFLHLFHRDIPFHWANQAQKSFESLKDALSQAPLIRPPSHNKDYTLYLSASDVSIAWVLVQDGPDNKERVIYYVSKNPFWPALKYEPEEKIALALVHSVPNLRHYIIL